MQKIVVPEMGDSLSSAFIVQWIRKEGDFVSEGEDILEVEAEKATLSIPSPGTGFLHIQIQEGEEITLGQAAGEILADKPTKEKTYE